MNKTKRSQENVLREWNKIFPYLKNLGKLSEKLINLNNKNLFTKDEIEALKCLEEASEMSMNKKNIEKEDLKFEINIAEKEITELAKELTSDNTDIDIKEQIKFIIKLTIPKENINDPQQWRKLKYKIMDKITNENTFPDSDYYIQLNKYNKIIKNLLEEEMPKDAKISMEKWEKVRNRIKHYCIIEISPESAKDFLIDWREFVKKSFKTFF